MRHVKKFKEYLEEGIVKKQRKDKPRSNFLKEEAEKDYGILLLKIEKLGIDDQTANDLIKTCYDLLLGLIRSKMFLKGYKASGFGAHEAEVAYLRELGFSEKEVQFLDQIRSFRNGILYYGSITNKENAIRIINFTKKLYCKLK